MSVLTWGEFKKIVDDGLKEKGGGDKTGIECIDVSYPSKDYLSCIPIVYMHGARLDVH